MWSRWRTFVNIWNGVWQLIIITNDNELYLIMELTRFIKTTFCPIFVVGKPYLKRKKGICNAPRESLFELICEAWGHGWTYSQFSLNSSRHALCDILPSTPAGTSIEMFCDFWSQLKIQAGHHEMYACLLLPRSFYDVQRFVPRDILVKWYASWA